MSAITKVALVTGAARGIGLAIAEAFLGSDYGVALLDIDAGTLGATGERLARVHGERALPVVCDVSQPDQTLAVDGGFDASGVGLPSLRTRRT